MDSVEANGKSVEEAIENALRQMGRAREEVEIAVLKKGRSGFLGLGSEDARVLVTLLPSVPVSVSDSVTDSVTDSVSDVSDLGKTAAEVLEKLLALMSVRGVVEIKSSSPDDPGSSTTTTLDIRGEGLGILIGRRGQTLASLQHIVRLIVARRLKGRADLVIDVEEYKERHYQSLRALASRLAQKVSSSGRSVTLEPMPANERRVVHLALADHPAVITQSVGDRDIRKVVILPKSRQRQGSQDNS